MHRSEATIPYVHAHDQFPPAAPAPRCRLSTTPMFDWYVLYVTTVNRWKDKRSHARRMARKGTCMHDHFLFPCGDWDEFGAVACSDQGPNFKEPFSAHGHVPPDWPVTWSQHFFIYPKVPVYACMHFSNSSSRLSPPT